MYVDVHYDAGADDPLASLRAAVAAAAWPDRPDFHLRVLRGRGVLHEAYDLWWDEGQPVDTAAGALALKDDAIVMAWTPDQFNGSE